jgi:hypothetical protein
VTATAIDDVRGFCIPEEKIFVFPEQMFKADAIDLCKAHGGYLFAPRNEEENAEVLERMNPFLSSCLDESSENIAWLGASVLNSTFHIIDENNNLVKSNFSKLDKEMF